MHEEISVFFDIDGKEYINGSEALSQLLHHDVLFCNYYDVRHPMYSGEGKSDRTVVLFVNCNDLFEYGADSEYLSSEEELISLYRLWKANGWAGLV